MKVSVCVTTFNEDRKDVDTLLNSLKNQSLIPDEIVIIDAKDYHNCSRSEGRNIAVSKARNEIIAMTDVGCIADKNWLRNITQPFEKNASVVAGYYKMTSKNKMQKAMTMFLGVLPNKFDNNFLPSTRSIAFTKSVWKKIGGFDEDLKGTAEDTNFNYKLIKNNISISRVKDAVVQWGMPKSLCQFFQSIFNYAKGDAQSKIWIFPGKGLSSHNIKALLVIVRYLFGLSLLLFYLFSSKAYILVLLCVLLILYFLYSYKKAGLWGVLLQIISDIGVISGFTSGIIGM